MADDRFDLYLTGTLAMGCDRARAVAQLAKLFKRPPEQVEKLLAGKATRIRKHISGEEISRLQLAFDKLGILTDSQPSPTASPQSAAIDQHAAAAPPESLSLSPVGSPVLRENERHRVSTPNIDTSHLSVGSNDQIKAQHRQTHSAPAPDVSHLQLLTPEEEAAQARERQTVQLDIDELCQGLSLAPKGSDMGAPQTTSPPPPPDTSHLRCR